jgi:hypothetical protein
MLGSTAFAATPIQQKRAALPWLGAALTPETVTADGVGHFVAYQHGSIYWKPSIGPHEVHGLIKKKWAQLGYQQNASLGYPISDEKPTMAGSNNRFNDFENGVVHWTSGASAAAVVLPNVLASRSPAQMTSLIENKVKSMLPSTVDGHHIVLQNICLCGPEPLGSPIGFTQFFLPTTDYQFSGSNVNGVVRNRLYKIEFSFRIAVTDPLPDPTVTVDMRLEVSKSGNNVVVRIYPQWYRSVHVPWPTSIGISAHDIGVALDHVVQPLLGKTLQKTAVPFNVLSVKVEANGALNTYTGT